MKKSVVILASYLIFIIYFNSILLEEWYQLPDFEPYPDRILGQWTTIDKMDWLTYNLMAYNMWLITPLGGILGWILTKEPVYKDGIQNFQSGVHDA